MVPICVKCIIIRENKILTQRTLLCRVLSVGRDVTFRIFKPGADMGVHMKHSSCRSVLPRVTAMRVVVVVVLGLFGWALTAQQPPSDSVAGQRAAMHKLAFLAGHWTGPVTVVRGPGEPLHLTQTENVEYKLDGLVLLIQGKSTGQDGKAQFEALATVAYDDASQTYRIRAYHAGQYVDTALSVMDNGFSWSMEAGPAHIVNTMHLTARGEWQETTEVTFGSNPPLHSVDMLLEKQ